MMKIWKYLKFGKLYDYTSFGEKLSEESLENPWQYQAKRFDSELDLIYFGKRYYDPQIARWTSVDPAGFVDGLNLYNYLKNNPFKYFDPEGDFAIVLIPVAKVVVDIIALAVIAVTVKWAGDTIVHKINETQTKTEPREQEKRGKKTNPFDGTVDEDVFIGDAEGNIIPVPEGQQLGGSKDGKWIQVKDADGKATGVRKDDGHPPSPIHDDPRSQQPHGHIPGVSNPDGTPWLPVMFF